MLLDRSQSPPVWQNFWMYALEQQYGCLGQGKRLLTSNITYELLTRSPPGTITDHMRFAFQMWGELEERPMETIQIAQLLAKEADRDSSKFDPVSTKTSSKTSVDTITVYTDWSGHTNNKVSKQSGFGFIVIFFIHGF